MAAADVIAVPVPDPDPYRNLILDDFGGIDIEFSLDDLLLFPDDGADDLCAPPTLGGRSSDLSSPSSTVHHSPADPRFSPYPSSSGDCSLSNPTAKRKALDGDDASNSNADSARKARRPADEEEEEEKRVARLMRNRESAHLSRQRKKHYVEELEEKVRAMTSTINELNSRISFVAAENAALRHQLTTSTTTTAPAPAVYPPYPMHFPWIPFPPGGYGMRSSGGNVPLVPIPRLKPQQPAPAPKVKRPSAKSNGKTKKAASVTLLGMLFISICFVYTGSRGFDLSRSHSHPHDSVLSVGGGSQQLNGNGTGGFEELTSKQCRSDGAVANTSDPLPALLYVPRNGRHVKINGNLIIHSVLASERAMTHELARVPVPSNGKGAGLTMRGRTASALAVHKARTELEKHGDIKSHGEGMYGESSKSAHGDGLLQQWFREGLAGPILSSGMCSEVFQFEVSPIPSNPSGIVPASVVNSTAVNSTHPAKANRRIMYHPIPLPGSLNNSNQFEGPSKGNSFQGNKSASTVLVSVLADPREAGDLDGDPMIPSSKSLSRIFVVLLIDRVKYVTYSCVLPFKGYKTHLVH